jgi:RNA 3'-phosphate cyclase
MITIDGSLGEGGGQILRTSVALSAVTGQAIHITDIRVSRTEPGLKAQHIASIKAVADLCNAQTEDVSMGSLEVTFKPGKIRSGKIKIDTRTAGSASLVLQALLFPAFFSHEKVVLQVRGGTDVTWSPSTDYLKSVTLPIIRKAGFKANLELTKRGYFPAGGGEVVLEVTPVTGIKPFNLLRRGRILSVKGISHSHKSLEAAMVSLRQAKSARTQIYNILTNHGFSGDIGISIEYIDAPSSGSGITLWAETEESVLGALGIGERSKRAEIVGKEVANNLISELLTNESLDKHMGDQIIPYLAVCTGKVTASEITSHTKTNVEVVNKFGFDVRIEGNTIIASETELSKEILSQKLLQKRSFFI